MTGTFNGLADGGKLYIGGVLYQINYRFGGRPGNDVALQGLDTPPPPMLIIQRAPARLGPPALADQRPALQSPDLHQSGGGQLDAALPLPVVIGTNNIVTNPA